MKNTVVLVWASLGLSMAAYGKPVNTFNLEHPHVPGQLIVKFKKDIPTEFRQSVLKEIKLSSGGIQLDSQSQAAVLGFSSLRSKDGLKAIAEQLDARPEVEYVEANLIYTLDETLPDDPDFSKLYGLNNVNNQGQKTRMDISATEAWDITTGSKDVVVGVIDTGIDYTHPDLAANMWKNEGETGVDSAGNDRSTNGIDDDNNGYVDDWQGWDFYNDDNDPLDGHSHGTHCAGTIGAKGNNGVGVVGVNWDVSLVGMKVFSDQGSTTAEALANAISYATTIGVDLTSNSWGGGGASAIIRDAISGADQAGILFVAAAGNSSSDNDSNPHYPSSYDLDNIIAVASTDRNDNMSSFSSYGLTSVDVGAPGSDIYSTVPGGRYGTKSGTSMATPHVAGLVALVKSQFPDLNHYQIRDRVLTTANPIASLQGKVVHGRIDALAALEIDEIAPSVPANVSLVNAGMVSLKVAWTASGDDGTEGEASRYVVKMHSEPVTADNWNDAEVVAFQVEESKDQKVVVSINNLAFNLSAYIAVMAVDNVGNLSTVSESIQFQLAEAEIVMENDGNLDLFETVEGDWNVQIADENTFITDSPDGNYANNSNASVVSNEIQVSTSETLVAFDSSYDLETRYDFGYFEVQSDGGDWQEVAKFNGMQSWKTNMYNLSPYISGASAFKFRFRVTTDASVQKDGWSIDNIKIIVPKS